MAGDPGPDWLRRPPRSPLDAAAQAADEVLLVLQRERSDGAELLTLRVPLAQFGAVLAYAGAGLNRTVYFAETSNGETFTTGHGRHRALGAAAELGAEWHVTERLAMSADLRWIDLAADAGLLRSGDSLVAADPFSLGVSLGWRFR
jgi:outer membrane protein W